MEVAAVALHKGKEGQQLQKSYEKDEMGGGGGGEKQVYVSVVDAVKINHYCINISIKRFRGKNVGNVSAFSLFFALYILDVNEGCWPSFFGLRFFSGRKGSEGKYSSSSSCSFSQCGALLLLLPLYLEEPLSLSPPCLHPPLRNEKEGGVENKLSLKKRKE